MALFKHVFKCSKWLGWIVLRWILPKLISGKGTGENNNTLYLPIVKTASARKRLA